jgi:EAL domain-containing protein (putative c-di-GMP-specific phosphodiesterase class I)
MNFVARSSLAVLLIKAHFSHISHANGNIDKSSAVSKVEATKQLDKGCQDAINISCFAIFAQEQRYVNQGSGSKLGKSAGIELFIRIPNPKEKGEFLNTEDFIVHINQIGQLGALTTKIIEKVIRNASALDQSNAPYYINLPPPLITPTFAKELAQKLTKAGLPNNLIGIELTEREAILDRVTFDAGMAELKQMGIPLAFDDYGRGNATREFLIGLPVERVKIDRGALCDAQKDAKLAEQLRLDIEFMQKSGIEVIAEGIETADDCTFALNLGCDGMQGHLLDSPKMLIPVDA